MTMAGFRRRQAEQEAHARKPERWRWWRDCRLLFMRHNRGYANPFSPSGRDVDGYAWRCRDCLARWDKGDPDFG